MSKTLSNIEYLIATARIIVSDSKKLKDAISVGEDNTERENLRSAWMSIANSNKFYIASVERVAESMGMSISEAFLLPGTFTDWYIDSDKKYFAENMKRLRLEKGWSKSKLSECAGIISNTIYKCEDSLGFPSVKNMQKIADALGVEIADMFLPPSGIADNDGGGENEQA